MARLFSPLHSRRPTPRFTPSTALAVPHRISYCNPPSLSLSLPHERTLTSPHAASDPVPRRRRAKARYLTLSYTTDAVPPNRALAVGFASSLQLHLARWRAERVRELEHWGAGALESVARRRRMGIPGACFRAAKGVAVDPRPHLHGPPSRTSWRDELGWMDWLDGPAGWLTGRAGNELHRSQSPGWSTSFGTIRSMLLAPTLLRSACVPSRMQQTRSRARPARRVGPTSASRMRGGRLRRS